MVTTPHPYQKSAAPRSISVCCCRCWRSKSIRNRIKIYGPRSTLPLEYLSGPSGSVSIFSTELGSVYS